MTYEELEKMMGKTHFADYGKHEPLTNLSCVYDCKSLHDGYKYQTEIIFAVPLWWLNEYLVDTTHEDWDWGDIQRWLESEYTSEDSQPILEKAIAENKVAFWQIN